jgi:type VI secretion system protein ImpJ
VDNKVIWSEGLFLCPEHFQQQDRYTESLLERRAGQPHANNWGILELEINRAGLLVGRFGLNRVRGIFPDGTPFDAPDIDPLPAPIALNELSSNRILYLALPRRRAGAVDLGEPGSMARFTASELELTNAVGTGAKKREITVGKLNIRLVVEGDDLGDLAEIAVGKVRDVTNGQVALTDDFAPPCLDVAASESLNGHMSMLLATVNQRAGELAGRIAMPRSGGDLGGELTELLMLQLLNRVEPVLRHLSNVRPLHPERLFERMLSLAGELATFTSTNKRIAELPEYEHRLPGPPYAELMDFIREALSVAIVRRAEQLEIRERAYGIRTVTIPDPRLVRTGRFILVAKADMTEEELRNRMPRQLRFGPVEEIASLVRRNLSGIELKALPHTPEELPYHAGAVFFELNRYHEMWKRIEPTAELAFHIGGDFPGLRLEMWVIKEVTS